jgi:putative flippase GtrA
MRRLWRLALQYARFGGVGMAATATHAVMFMVFIELVGLAPLVANFAAFGIAVLVSFLGHFHWTFRNETAGHDWQQQRTAFVKFALVALAGLTLNSLAVILVVNLLALPYQYALILMVCIVPLLVFALSKFWAFA